MSVLYIQGLLLELGKSVITIQNDEWTIELVQLPIANCQHN